MVKHQLFPSTYQKNGWFQASGATTNLIWVWWWKSPQIWSVIMTLELYGALHWQSADIPSRNMNVGRVLNGPVHFTNMISTFRGFKYFASHSKQFSAGLACCLFRWVHSSVLHGHAAWRPMVPQHQGAGMTRTLPLGWTGIKDQQAYLKPPTSNPIILIDRHIYIIYNIYYIHIYCLLYTHWLPVMNPPMPRHGSALSMPSWSSMEANRSCASCTTVTFCSKNKEVQKYAPWS